MMVGFSPSSIGRALAILDLLVEHSEGLALSVIAERIDQPKSATHRFLSVLMEHRYVTQLDDKRYALSMRFASMGLRFLDEVSLTDVCQPVLNQLASDTGELVRLAVLEADKLIVIAKAQGATSHLRYEPSNGGEIAAFAGAGGQIWLAQLPDAEAMRIARAAGLGRRDLQSTAPRTEAELRKNLKLARERGYGQQIEAVEIGIAAVAVPLIEYRDGSPRVLGSLSIAGPTSRMSVERMRDMVPAMKVAAKKLVELWPARQRATVLELVGTISPASKDVASDNGVASKKKWTKTKWKSSPQKKQVG
jgi:DNA-binding IclR family transcriptional regulator